ncbi:MAG: hypothetical protein ACREFX_10080, partial [Opitutaceae bacterium]
AARRAPVLIEEFGVGPSRGYARFMTRIIAWIGRRQFGAAAWSMNTTAAPCLITGWNYRPSYWEGTYVLNWLRGGPSAPASLEAGGEAGRIALSWSPVPGAERYAVYRSARPGREQDRPARAAKVAGTSFLDRGLGGGATYYYRVAAVTDAGQSGLSPEIGATAGRSGDFEAPLPRFDLRAAASPANAAVNRPVAVTVRADNVGRGDGSGVLIVIGVRDASGNVIAQREFRHQSFPPGRTRSFSWSWTPPEPGTYRVWVAAFGDGYSPKYDHKDVAATIVVPDLRGK